MEETVDVNRDTIVSNVGSHIPYTEALFEEEETFKERVEETTQSPSRISFFRIMIQKRKVKLSYQIPQLYPIL